MDQSRSTQRREQPQHQLGDAALRQWLREVAADRPRSGYRRLCALLRTEGRWVNHKKIERLCREEGPRVRSNVKKR